MLPDVDRCYRAFVTHDPRWDGRIFGGVVTTGVYCRPVCPVRPAKRQNCRFFACAAAAEAAGFRPCRRCRPEAAPGTPAWTGTSAIVGRACRLIASGALDDGDVEALAARVGVGGRQLRRLFVRHLGATPADIARARRVHFARALIDETRLPMTDVAVAAGFNSVRQFNHAVRATFRAAPTALRRAHRRQGPENSPLVLRLAYRPPFDWPALLAFLGPRAIPGVELVEGAVYRRTIAVSGAVGTIAVRDAGSGHVVVHVDVPEHAGLMHVVARVRRMFGLDDDPHEIATALARSPRLRRLVRRRPGLRVPGAWDSFELGVRAVLGQQVTVRGATTLAGRLVRAFGTPLDGAADGLAHLFPSPATLAEADVATIGLPAARAGTIRRFARAVAAGGLVFDAARGAEDAIARLRAIPGIGPWTAEYIAMRTLGEPDAFPVGDLGLRQACGNGDGPVTTRELARLAEDWRPWRAYAAMHLWRSLDQEES